MGDEENGGGASRGRKRTRRSRPRGGNRAAAAAVEEGGGGTAAAPVGTAAAAAGEKAVLVVAYLGGAYRGSARNDQRDSVPTVEGCLWKAISRATAAAAEAAANPGDGKEAPPTPPSSPSPPPPSCAFYSPLVRERTNPRSFTRSSRTDKGVSALGNVYGLVLPSPSPLLSAHGGGGDDESRRIGLVNDFLPGDVRLLRFMAEGEGRDGAAAAAFRNFNARTCCDVRRYRYVVPAGALEAKRRRGGGRDEEDDKGGGEFGETTMCIRKRLKKVLLQWGGTHSFHNFTTAATTTIAASQEERQRKLETQAIGDGDGEESREREPARGKKNPGAGGRVDDHYKRHILRCHAEDVLRHNGRDYVVISVKGSSFLKHQIRKMIGATIGVMNGTLPADYIAAALDENTTAKREGGLPGRPAGDGGARETPGRGGGRAAAAVVDAVPLAPAEGLVLVDAVYSRYCSKHRLEPIGSGTKLLHRETGRRHREGEGEDGPSPSPSRWAAAAAKLAEETLAFQERVYERICRDQEANYFGGGS